LCGEAIGSTRRLPSQVTSLWGAMFLGGKGVGHLQNSNQMIVLSDDQIHHIDSDVQYI